MKCRACGGEFRQKVEGDENKVEREHRCKDCGKGFRWTIWKQDGKLIKKLYEVL